MTATERTSAPRWARLLEPSGLPFSAPDFSRVHEEDFRPAFDAAMAAHRTEVAEILSTPDPATFENTVAALERSGAPLSRVASVFYALTSADTTAGLDALDAELAPRLTAHHDAITLDPALFARVRAVVDRGRAEEELGTEDAMLLRKTVDGMVHAGAELTEEARERVKALNAELSGLTTQFAQRVREATNAAALPVASREELRGLSEGEVGAAARLAAEGGAGGAAFSLALLNTTQQPLLVSLEDRGTRRRLFERSVHRCDGTDPRHDTRPLVARIAALRAEKAAIFGRADWCDYTLWDTMAGKSEALAFLAQMVPALAAAQKRDAATLAERAGHPVRPWDWARFAEQERKARFDLDEGEVSAYFELTRVLEDGVFFAANLLYGVRFVRRTDLPVYHDDVSVFTVVEDDGTEIGLFYFDPFARPSKRGGAWMDNFVEQSHECGTKPVVVNVLNIPKAADGEPQLVCFDDVRTMFHEAGHALNGLFADQRFASLAGTSTSRDWVEFASQVNEMWAMHPEVLANYGAHHSTGEPIPPELIAKIEAAAKFNQGYEFGELVAAALLDIKWHALSKDEAAAIATPDDVDAFERKALGELGLEIDDVPPRYRSTFFSHIFSSPVGYSSGYYSYLWTEMLDRDAREWFLERGGATRANGDHFRATVLSRGATLEYAKMFENFAGRAPDVKPMLAARGLEA